MELGELESYLQGGVETPTFEVKADMAWSDKSLAKDILAMANMRDGGYIVIGIRDGSFERQGVNEGNLATYQIDQMRTQMAKWADPNVSFSVTFPVDKDENRYVAIRVSSFRDTPVICKLDGADVHAGKIYYRTTNQGVRSAPIDNAYDMRDLIITAAARTSESFRRLGVQIASPSEAFRAELDAELGDL